MIAYFDCDTELQIQFSFLLGFSATQVLLAHDQW